MEWLSSLLFDLTWRLNDQVTQIIFKHNQGPHFQACHLFLVSFAIIVGSHGVSICGHFDCLFSNFRRTIKGNMTGPLCKGNLPVSGDSPHKGPLMQTCHDVIMAPISVCYIPGFTASRGSRQRGCRRHVLIVYPWRHRHPGHSRTLPLASLAPA